MSVQNKAIGSPSMKFNYCKSVIRNNFGYGVLMVAVGLFAVYINKESAFSYLWIVMGLLQAATAWYKMRYQYLSVEKGRLVKHSFIPKSVPLSEIKKVRRFKNTYRIETENSSMYIDKEFMEHDSLSRLNRFFDTIKPVSATAN